MIKRLTILISLFVITLIGVFAIADWVNAAIFYTEDFDDCTSGTNLGTCHDWDIISGSNYFDITSASDNIYKSPYKSLSFISANPAGIIGSAFTLFDTVGSTANTHYFDFDFTYSTTTNGTATIYFQTPERITACSINIVGKQNQISGGMATTSLTTNLSNDEDWYHVTVRINNDLETCSYSAQNLTTGAYLLTYSDSSTDTYTAYNNLSTKEIGRIEILTAGCTGGGCVLGENTWIDNLAYAPVNTSGELVAISFLQATSSDSLYATFVNFASSSFPILSCDADGTWGASLVKVTICHIRNGIMDLMRVFFVPPQFTLDMFKESIEGFRDVFPMSVLFEAMDSIYYGLAISETDSALTLPTLTTAAGQTVFPGYTFVSTTSLASVDGAYTTYRTIMENVIWISLFIGIIGIII